MKRIRLLLLVLTFAGACVAGERPKSVIKSSHLSPYAVAITCLNDADPTGRKIDNVLIISCGK